ncbi:MAG: hypothetical protein ACYSUF_06930, partial [Planctomycetota bacterium]
MTAADKLENSGEQKLGNGSELRRVAKLYGTAPRSAANPDSDLSRSRCLTAWMDFRNKALDRPGFIVSRIRRSRRTGVD